jgi:plastocyanin
MDFLRFLQLRSVGPIVLILTARAAFGSDVDVFVLDRDGQPVADVAVYAAKPDGQKSLPTPTANAVMDQVDKQFVPHLLVVQSGTSVEFPNSDTVAHHVYSFSHPNKFMLPMYKGVAHPPVTFKHSGVAILGCNIHDHMLSYILIVDSVNYTKTDESGKASLSLERPEDYEIRIWSPRIRDHEGLLSKTVVNPESMEPAVSFQLTRKLGPPRGDQVAAWQDY